MSFKESCNGGQSLHALTDYLTDYDLEVHSVIQTYPSFRFRINSG